MTIDAVQTRVKDFVLGHFASARGIGVGDHLLRSGVIDSLGILDVVSFIEQEFGITLSDEDLVPDHFASIERIAAFVFSKTGQLDSVR
jgi:acyl carrier protein